MNTPNIGWFFYKGYYFKGNSLAPEMRGENAWGDIDLKKVEEENEKKNTSKANLPKFEKRNKALFDLKWADIKNVLADADTSFSLSSTNQTIHLTTTYPGLLIGGGYTHGTNNAGEIKLGFYFDHTTGLPVVPGSSVKGVLRFAFEHYDYVIRLFKNLYASKLYYQDYLPSEWHQLIERNYDFTNENIKSLIVEIFGKHDEVERDSKTNTWDIFYEAFIAQVENDKERFLGDDYITPHKHETNPKLDQFAEPNPIPFLKILPEVTFQFQFDLKPSKVKDKKGNVLNIADKLAIFCLILLDLGVGAKTNVGYGRFQKTDKHYQDLLVDSSREELAASKEEEIEPEPEDTIPMPPKIYRAKMKIGDKIKAKIVAINDKNLTLKLLNVEGYPQEKVIEMSNTEENYQKGRTLLFTVTAVFNASGGKDCNLKKI